jgi:ABC-type lipoprotein release transport system permease subunit
MALLSGRFLRSLLYGVTATDPRVYVVTSVVLTMVALAACWLPARRAGNADPATVLREE